MGAGVVGGQTRRLAGRGDFAGEPDADVGPIAFGRALGHAKHGRRLRVGEAGKETQLDQLGAVRIDDADYSADGIFASYVVRRR